MTVRPVNAPSLSRVPAGQRTASEEPMKYFSRPYKFLGVATLLGLTMASVTAPPGAPAQTTIAHIMQEINPLISHTQGYLGVLVSDVDTESANKFKLKDVRGAIITLIDHDAPAGQIGLRVNDVVLSVNGQAVEGAEQFGRMMREIPAGHKVALVISRDGAPQTITVQLVDRKKMEHDVWNKMNNSDAFPPPPAGMGWLPGEGEGWSLGHVSPFGSSLNVGAMVEPLTAQMADYLGVQSGVMIKQVARKSEAAGAGFKAFDVVLKVGNESIQTVADWDRALRSNEGKQVPVTILRERKQQVINLQVDSKHHSWVEQDDLFPESACPDMAALESGLPGLSELLGDQAPSPFTEKDLEQLQRQFRDTFNAGAFPELKMDPKAMDDLRQQMEQFRQSFNPDQLRIDPKIMQDLERQMEEFRKAFPQNPPFDRKQLDQFRRQQQHGVSGLAA
ncbi:PDZ domain-containing protein [Acidobacteria bacterium AB60]|nr:PDZ domain-containing protein [Acidobacteria bacterium AB60]